MFVGDFVDYVCNYFIDVGIYVDDIVVDIGNSLWIDFVVCEE